MIRTRVGVAALTTALLGTLMPAVVLGQDGAETPEGVEWALSQYASEGALVDVPDGVEATLRLEDGIASGSAGCNSFSGSYTIDGSTIAFDPAITTTEMACEGDAQVVEDAYLAVLPTATSWAIADGALQLSGAEAEPILVFGGSVAGSAPSDIDDVLAALDALQVQVAALDGRVAELEAAASSDGGNGAPDGNGNGNGQRAQGPRAPGTRGRVQTTFPEYLRDPSTPPDQVEDPNRELVRWRDRSNNEDGFNVYARRGYCVLREGVDPEQELGDDDFRLERDRPVLIDQLPADRTRYRPAHLEIDEQLPEKPVSPYSNDEFYDVLVTAYNEAGESRRRLVASFYLTPEFRCP